MPPKAPVEAPVESPVLYVVLESFLGTDGTVYQKGEVIHPDDPHIKFVPSRFGPFAFPHPVKRRGITLAAPELRAG